MITLSNVILMIMVCVDVCKGNMYNSNTSYDLLAVLSAKLICLEMYTTSSHLDLSFAVTF